MTTIDAAPTENSSRATTVIGWTLSGLLIAFMAFDCAIKLIDVPQVAETMTQMGIPPELGRPVGVIELICLVLYIVPRTSVLGAILLTALFGGAIASHLRLFDPWFSHTLFGVYLGLFAWGGLWFRNARLRRLIPIDI